MSCSLPCCTGELQGASSDASNAQMSILKKRRGRLLNRRTILKSYLFNEEGSRGPPEVSARCWAGLAPLGVCIVTAVLVGNVQPSQVIHG